MAGARAGCFATGKPGDSRKRCGEQPEVLEAVAKLSTKQRQVLHLVFYQDLTVEEASRVMEINLGTARTHFDRGKRRLREILAGQGGKG
jgi:RNA polymerase sigma-70 factor (ECF subfamily)